MAAVQGVLLLLFDLVADVSDVFVVEVVAVHGVAVADVVVVGDGVAGRVPVVTLVVIGAELLIVGLAAVVSPGGVAAVLGGGDEVGGAVVVVVDGAGAGG